MKTVKNFLPKDYFKDMQKKIMSDHVVPFYFNSHVAADREGHNIDNYYFTHNVYDKNLPGSNLFDLFVPMLELIECKSLIRIKVNCYPRTTKLFHHAPHRDYDYSHKAMILSLNTCDGGTEVGGNFVESIENQALFFDASLGHNSTTCTNQKCRFNINVNYF